MAYHQRWSDFFDMLDADVDYHDVPLLKKGMAIVFGLAENAPELANCTRAFEDLTSLIANYDANNDGKLSKSEFFAAVDKAHRQKKLEEQDEWWRQRTDFLFSAVDSNSNGEISLEEISKLINRVNPSESEEKIREAYEWGLKQGSSGKIDVETFRNIVHQWTSILEPTPYATILLPFFKKFN